MGEKNTFYTISIFNELGSVMMSFGRKKHLLYYIFFIILYRFAEGFAIKIAPLFFKASREVGGLGLSTENIGIIYGIGGSIAFVIGSILGGYTIAHFGLKRTLFKLCLVFNIPFVVYFLLAYFQPTSLSIITTAVVFEYFGYGFGFVGLTYFMMEQIAPGKFKMAYYAIASGIMNLGVMLPGMLSGKISDAIGYKDYFIFVLIMIIPSLLITFFVPFSYTEEEVAKMEE